MARRAAAHGAGGEAQLVRQRLLSQMLAGPPGSSAPEVVGRLLAVQAQDGRGFRLSVRSRTSGLTASDVDRDLDDRLLVVTWLNRGTLHLVTVEDFWWLHRLLAARATVGIERRLRQEGVRPPEVSRGVDTIVDALVDDGPQLRAELRRRVHAVGVPTGGQALVYLLAAASAAGAVVRGPTVGAEQAFAAVSQWLGPAPPALEHEEALARLAGRYLAGHAPAGPADLAKWAGIPLGESRAAFAAIADEIDTDASGLSRPADGPGVIPDPPSPRLLGPFDPLLHGWASREAFVGDHAGIVTTNGLFRPVALVAGRVVATWGMAGGTVTIRPLEAMSTQVRRALADDAGLVQRFLGLAPSAPVFE